MYSQIWMWSYFSVRMQVHGRLTVFVFFYWLPFLSHPFSVWFVVLLSTRVHVPGWTISPRIYIRCFINIRNQNSLAQQTTIPQTRSMTPEQYSYCPLKPPLTRPPYPPTYRTSNHKHSPRGSPSQPQALRSKQT